MYTLDMELSRAGGDSTPEAQEYLNFKLLLLIFWRMLTARQHTLTSLTGPTTQQTSCVGRGGSLRVGTGLGWSPTHVRYKHNVRVQTLVVNAPVYFEANL